MWDRPPRERSQTQATAPPPKPSKRRPYVVLATAATLLLGGVGSYWGFTAGQETTDDAQITADLVPVAARVAGQVTRIAIAENRPVKKGELIAEIDRADYAAKVQQAEAELATVRAQAAAATAQVEAARASIQRAGAERRRVDRDLHRARQLNSARVIPRERLDNAAAAAESARALQREAGAHIAAARANAELAQARVKSARAAVDLANLQLSYTWVIAPADGVASKLSVHEGQLVQPGLPIVQLVPAAVYVLANFKETQIAKMRPGQTAEIRLDAYGGRPFQGTVESLSRGTGASFSLMPPDNASGNFVKVVQRVPVRIALKKPPADWALAAGLSAEATVYIR
jgi:membrane fusion protein (multidrug efflux system)